MRAGRAFDRASTGNPGARHPHQADAARIAQAGCMRPAGFDDARSLIPSGFGTRSPAGGQCPVPIAVKSVARGSQRMTEMEALWRDLKLAFRSLRRAPSYTLAAAAALALAIGANTALFSLIEATLLRPYPYPHPEDLLIVRETSPQFDDSSVSYPNFFDWPAQSRDSFSCF